MCLMISFALFDALVSHRQTLIDSFIRAECWFRAKWMVHRNTSYTQKSFYANCWMKTKRQTRIHSRPRFVRSPKNRLKKVFALDEKKKICVLLYDCMWEFRFDSFHLICVSSHFSEYCRIMQWYLAATVRYHFANAHTMFDISQCKTMGKLLRAPAMEWLNDRTYNGLRSHILVSFTYSLRGTQCDVLDSLARFAVHSIRWKGDDTIWPKILHWNGMEHLCAA